MVFWVPLGSPSEVGDRVKMQPEKAGVFRAPSVGGWWVINGKDWNDVEIYTEKKHEELAIV